MLQKTKRDLRKSNCFHRKFSCLNFWGFVEVRVIEKSTLFYHFPGTNKNLVLKNYLPFVRSKKSPFMEYVFTIQYLNWYKCPSRKSYFGVKLISLTLGMFYSQCAVKEQSTSKGTPKL